MYIHILGTKIKHTHTHRYNGHSLQHYNLAMSACTEPIEDPPTQTATPFRHTNKTEISPIPMQISLSVRLMFGL